MDCLDHWNTIVNRKAMDMLLTCGETLDSSPMELRPLVAEQITQMLCEAHQVETQAHGFWLLAEAYCEVVLRKQLEWFTTVLQDCQSTSDKRYMVNQNQRNVKRVLKRSEITQQLPLYQWESQ